MKKDKPKQEYHNMEEALKDVPAYREENRREKILCL
jgi:hypothetical protein